MGKPDYVDRQRLKEAIREDAINLLSCYNEDVLSLVLSEIDEIPAAEQSHIDREAWEPCESCKKKSCDNCEHGYDTTGENENCAKCIEESEWKPAYAFCPWCGRPMDDAAWEMLKGRMGDIGWPT